MKWACGLVSLSAIVGLSLAILCTKRPATARAEVEADARRQTTTAASATPRANTPKAAAQPDRDSPLSGLTLTDVPPPALPPSGTPASAAPKPGPVFPMLATPSTLAHTTVPALPPAAGREPNSALLDGVPPHATTARAAPTLSPSAAPALRDAGTVPVTTNDSANKGVQLEWLGATCLQVGQLAEYSLMVRNRSTDMVHDAVVHLQVPAGIEVKATTPAATGDHGSWLWRFETLLPGQVVHLHVNLVASTHGNSAPQASITYTSTVAATLALSAYQPKLALHVKRPTRVVLGDTAGFTIKVTNPGDGPAENVTVHAALSAGLDHPRGKLVDFGLGNLGAGESREIQLVCAANGDGEQHCDVTTTARAGVHASEQATIRVLAPRLDLQVKGPTVRYVERRATYTMLVANKGDFPAYNVSASEILPAGFRFLSASGGGHFEPSTSVVSWFVGELGPGQTRDVQFEVQAVRAGSY
ncbi:MAG TPA: hypothetical protein VFA18_09615, partial [Gemmataceae bacterium]|nr:hypothetical protein [Gemmataceae bacterium]